MAARSFLGVILRLLQPRWLLHGSGCGDCGGVCSTDGRSRQLIRPWRPPPTQGLEPSPTQKLRRHRVDQRPAPELLCRH
jgi:hypothetical protein